jgi:hypothetical protein
LGVDEREAKTVFQVEYTEYGWAVSIGGRRVAVYPWQEEALAYVEERRAELRAKGESSSVVVRGRA